MSVRLGQPALSRVLINAGDDHIELGGTNCAPYLKITCACADTNSMTDAIRIMLVDDTPIARDSIAALLRGQGHEVLVLADGIEAVESYDTYQPQLTIMDVDMPRLDGLSATRQILTVNPEARIVVYSGRDREALALEAGACVFLLKDFDIVERILDQVSEAAGN